MENTEFLPNPGQAKIKQRAPFVYYIVNINLSFFLFFSSIVILSGCAKSPDPEVRELVASRPPTFGGLENRSYTTASSPYTLNGECEPRHYGLEISYDQINWSPLNPGCRPNGTFSFVVEVPSEIEVFIRAKTKLGYTPISKAYVRLLLPPTSPFYANVTAGAVRFPGFKMGIESTMSINFSNETLEDSDVKVFTGILGVVYSE
jgi:hypothetical protein